jgi:hypothetical protein
MEPASAPAEGCVLAIVGSRDVPKYLSESIIREALLLHKPSLVVSGGAHGVDTDAAILAREEGFATLEIVPKVQSWDGAPFVNGHSSKVDPRAPGEYVIDGGVVVVVEGGFKIRNEKVAETCDCLIRIASRTTRTYGSGWTADRAQDLGKNVYRHIAG